MTRESAFIKLENVLSNQRHDDTLVSFNPNALISLALLRKAVARHHALHYQYCVAPKCNIDAINTNNTVALHFEDTLNFVISFLSSLYAKKNILLLSDFKDESYISELLDNTSQYSDDCSKEQSALERLAQERLSTDEASQGNKSYELIRVFTDKPQDSESNGTLDVHEVQYKNLISESWWQEHAIEVTKQYALVIEQKLRNSELGLNKELSIFFFTSGSTGKKKIVQKQVLIMERESKLLFDELSQKIFDGALPLVFGSVYPHHLYGLTFRVFLSMLFGVPFSSELTHYTEELCNGLAKIAQALPSKILKPIFITSPAFMRYVDTTLSVNSVFMAVSAGGALDKEIAAKFLTWSKAQLFEIYGSTETGVVAFRWFKADDDTKLIPFNYINGQIIDAVSSTANANINSLCDEAESAKTSCLIEAWHMFNGIDLTDNETVLLSPLVPNGYISLSDRLERVGDRHFLLHGRSDSIIKIDEKRFSLNDIKAKVVSLDEIADALIVPFNRQGRVLIGAIVKLKPQILENIIYDEDSHLLKDFGVILYISHDLSRLKKDWRCKLLNVLDTKVVPRRVMVVKDFPYNEMGKIKLSLLKEIFEAD